MNLRSGGAEFCVSPEVISGKAKYAKSPHAPLPAQRLFATFDTLTFCFGDAENADERGFF
jgi:hypothetical protein